jgi:hypothetical protein
MLGLKENVTALQAMLRLLGVLVLIILGFSLYMYLM